MSFGVTSAVKQAQLSTTTGESIITTSSAPSPSSVVIAAETKSTNKDTTIGFTIRIATTSDRDGMYNVCLKTGDSGQDATHLYSDPLCLGHRYVGAYMHLQPELSYALVDTVNGEVCGYTLGCLDSGAFYPRLVTEWLTPLATKHPSPSSSRREQWSRTEAMYDEFHHPTIFYPPLLHSYPSHLHIDLLPRAQRKGLGTALIDRLCAALKARGSTGVHLEMSSINSNALSFYKKLGFTEIARVTQDGTILPLDSPPTPIHNLYLGKSLKPSPSPP